VKKNTRKARNTRDQLLYPLVSFQVKKINKKIKKIPETQERQETQETREDIEIISETSERGNNRRMQESKRGENNGGNQKLQGFFQFLG
jgi:hypothetical protein